jgi:hypothetical protein
MPGPVRAPTIVGGTILLVDALALRRMDRVSGQAQG